MLKMLLTTIAVCILAFIIIEAFATIFTAGRRDKDSNDESDKLN